MSRKQEGLSSIELVKLAEANAIELIKGAKGDYRWNIKLTFSNEGLDKTLQRLVEIDLFLRKHFS